MLRMEHFSTTAPMLTKTLSSLLTCRYTIGGGRVVAEGQRHEPQGSELIDNIDDRYLSAALKGTIRHTLSQTLYVTRFLTTPDECPRSSPLVRVNVRVDQTCRVTAGWRASHSRRRCVTPWV